MRKKYLKNRENFLIVFVFFIFLILFFRLIKLQLIDSEHFLNLSSKQSMTILRPIGKRGDILDVHLKVLATDIPAFSIYAHPHLIKNTHKVALKLSKLLNAPYRELLKKIESKKKFVWLRRKISLEKMQKIKKLNIKGIGFIKEYKRVYPHGKLASHLLGFTDIDGKGLEELELFYNDFLKGQRGLLEILKDARGRILEIKERIKRREGFTLILNIDSFIQKVVEEELFSTVKKFRAKSGSCIVIEPSTGRVLALANFPDYDPNFPFDFPKENLRNRCVTDFYEPGSVFKIVTSALALEKGIFKEEDKIFCENGKYRVFNHILHDHVPHGILSFKEILIQSSNIGITKIAQKIGLKEIVNFAKKFGFGEKTGIDLPGETPGVVKPLSRYSKISIASFPIGQEVCVSCLQMAVAFCALVNGGFLMKPFVAKEIVSPEGIVIKRFEPKVIRRVISKKTSERMKKILYEVVNSGTARLAKIEGLAIGGKTGTAQKIENGKYSHSLFRASFVGFFPVDKPQIVISLVFDEPKVSYYGGVVAAPTFKNILLRIKDYLKKSYIRTF